MLTLAALLAFAGPAFAITDPVKIDTGQFRGRTGTSVPAVRTYKGIPFAAPPPGDNRWRAPQPAAKWDGVRKAEAFGAPCIAGPAPPAGGAGGAGAPGGAGAALRLHRPRRQQLRPRCRRRRANPHAAKTACI